MRNIINRLIPFIFLGIMIVIFVAGIILLSYLLIYGAIVGIIIYLIVWIKEQLFNKKKSPYPEQKKRSGRTIDHDDL
jgi:hypothetical protein